MTERRNPGCAFGPCNDSKQVGGPGCYLCDVIAMLPQKGSGARIDSNEEAPDGGMSETLTLTSEPTTKKAKKGAAPRKGSKRGGQPGRLF